MVSRHRLYLMSVLIIHRKELKVMNYLIKLKKIFHSKFCILDSCRGSTLIEMIIYMGLLSILLVILTNMFASILDVRTESEATSSVQQDGRFLLSRLSYDINRATSISAPLNLGDTSGNLSMTIGATTYTYSLVGGNLQLGTDNLNSSESSVSNLSFRKVGNSGGKDNIKIHFTLTSKTQRSSGNEVRDFDLTVGRR